MDGEEMSVTGDRLPPLSLASGGVTAKHDGIRRTTTIIGCCTQRAG